LISSSSQSRANNNNKKEDDIAHRLYQQFSWIKPSGYVANLTDYTPPPSAPVSSSSISSINTTRKAYGANGSNPSSSSSNGNSSSELMIMLMNYLPRTLCQLIMNYSNPYHIVMIGVQDMMMASPNVSSDVFVFTSSPSPSSPSLSPFADVFTDHILPSLTRHNHDEHHHGTWLSLPLPPPPPPHHHHHHHHGPHHMEYHRQEHAVAGVHYYIIVY
jgi:hypothetical protein